MSLCSIRAAWMLTALLAANVSVHAAELQAVTVAQPERGTVIVTVRSPDEAPPASAFNLNLQSGGIDMHVPASAVTPASNPGADLATTVIICIDRSGSMQGAVREIRSALRDVLATPRPDLRIGIMAFGSTITPLSPFTSDANASMRVIDGIQGEVGHDGQTKLFDAIASAGARLANDPARGPKRLIVISDGKDEGSRMPRETLVDIAHQRQAPLDTIAFGPLAPRWSGSLASLSSATGGKFVLVESGPKLADAIRNELGTTQPSAYDVRFGYRSEAGTATASTAALAYAPPGRPVALIPINVAIAAPATNEPAPVPPPDPEPKPPVVTPPQSHSWLDMKFTFLSLTIDTKGLFAGLLALIAGSLAMFFALRRKRAPEPERETQAPAQNRVRAETVREHQGTRVGAVFGLPAPGRPAAILVNTSQRHPGKPYPIEKTAVRIGADDDNDLVVPDDGYVSRRHAAIRFDGGTLYLTDLNSSNGTWRNDVRLGNAPVSLAPGDVLRFARTTYEVRGVERQAPHDEAGRRENRYERRVP